MSRTAKKNKNEQAELPLIEMNAVMVGAKDKKVRKKEDVPATELMKVVAAKTFNEKNMAKVFTQEELEDILSRRDAGESLEPREHKALRDQYRKMKRQVKEMEKGNKERVILVPSISQKGEFYKLFDFSALYYVYRLADRMGRNAKLMRDTDRFSKTLYAASLVGVEKFVEQMKKFDEAGRVEVTEDGIYIFTLKKPLTDDEVGELRMVEETRRERLHNVLKPKKMDPAVFQSILMVVRQVAPRVRKLEKQYYYAIGEEMLRDLNKLLARYFDFANGVISREVAKEEIVMIVDKLFAALTILSEMRVWDYGVAAVIGENVNEVRRLVAKEFGMRDEK